jgi:hypothetical protein
MQDPEKIDAELFLRWYGKKTMLGIIGIAALLTILGLSLVITRLATVALSFTGLSYESARFQARSAFTGTGFTTSEAESITSHPVRRRIVMALMLLRSAGIVSIILSLILSFMGSGEGAKLTRLFWLVGGVLALWLLSMSKLVDGALKRIMQRSLKKWTDVDVRDYVGLLKLSGDYVIRELHIREGDWLAGKDLTACRLREEGVSIIGIYRSNGNYVGVPKGTTVIRPGDTLILYGRSDALHNLDTRETGTRGDREHDEAVSDQQQRMREQDKKEEDPD